MASVCFVQLLRVNDVAVSNLREVVSAVEACKSDYLTLNLDYDQVGLLSVDHFFLPCWPVKLQEVVTAVESCN